MGEELPANADHPARKRASWSLRTIVEDVAGRPIGDLQDPDRPVHPYLRSRSVPTGAPSSGPALPAERASDDPLRRNDLSEPGTDDPLERVYPPLTGATGRAYHGSAHEHHPETLAHHASLDEPLSPGVHRHLPGPSRRPERLYLHYLLLHLDRLNDAALAYLQYAVQEEVDHRGRTIDPPPPEEPGPSTDP